MQLVWFKRDLRVSDNAALHGAMMAADRVPAVYILKPGFWQQLGMSRRHHGSPAE